MSFFDQDVAFFCDESGTTTGRYLLVGGLAIERAAAAIVLSRIAEFRSVFQMTKELKWTRISDQKIEAYEAFTDLFFDLKNEGLCNFHCLVFDNSAWKHAKYNGGDGDVGLSKLFYQLMHQKVGKYYGARGSLFIRMDQRNSSTGVESLRRMLNAAAARDHRNFSQPYKVIQPYDSKQCDILQLNDVILGAVCAARNGRHLSPDGRVSKKEIAKRVLRLSGLADFERDTEFHRTDFTVWNMRPR